MWWTYLGISLFLTLFAGLCSGLTVGMTGIDALDLEVIENKGKESNDPQVLQDSANAAKLRHVLHDHHLLLATLLLSNSVAMESLPIFLDALVPAIFAVLISTTLVLIFGEVVPQAICTGPNQISIAVAMIPIVKFLICILYPICKPIGICLDKLLGVHEDKRYKKRDLRELIKLHEMKTSAEANNDMLTHEEVGILLSTIELRDCTVTDPKVLIPIDKCFKLYENDVIDHDMIDLMIREGYTRMPVCAGNKHSKELKLMGLMGVKRI